MRDAVAAQLAGIGIETRPMFYPMNEMPACIEFPCARDLSNSARIARSGIVLPSGPTLTEDDVAYICEHFKRVIADRTNKHIQSFCGLELYCWKMECSLQ